MSRSAVAPAPALGHDPAVAPLLYGDQHSLPPDLLSYVQRDGNVIYWSRPSWRNPLCLLQTIWLENYGVPMWLLPCFLPYCCSYGCYWTCCQISNILHTDVILNQTTLQVILKQKNRTIHIKNIQSVTAATRPESTVCHCLTPELNRIIIDDSSGDVDDDSRGDWGTHMTVLFAHENIDELSHLILTRMKALKSPEALMKETEQQTGIMQQQIAQQNGSGQMDQYYTGYQPTPMGQYQPISYASYPPTAMSGQGYTGYQPSVASPDAELDAYPKRNY
jgi:hypothetical protein